MQSEMLGFDVQQTFSQFGKIAKANNDVTLKLNSTRKRNTIGFAVFSRQLAAGTPAVKAAFTEIDVTPFEQILPSSRCRIKS